MPINDEGVAALDAKEERERDAKQQPLVLGEEFVAARRRVVEVELDGDTNHHDRLGLRLCEHGQLARLTGCFACTNAGNGRG